MPAARRATHRGGEEQQPAAEQPQVEQPTQPEQPAQQPQSTPQQEQGEQQQGSPTDTESKVTARDQLDERENPEGPASERLEEQAGEQETQQQEELQSGDRPSGAVAKMSEALEDMVPAGARAGVHRHAQTQGGFMDQLSRRDGRDALEGHPCRIDLGHEGVKEEYDRLFGNEDHFPDGHDGDYGIYLQPALRDPETGVPVTAQVRLRDDTHALVTVPYEALRYSPNVGRR